MNHSISQSILDIGSAAKGASSIHEFETLKKEHEQPKSNRSKKMKTKEQTTLLYIHYFNRFKLVIC
jgi:hypothetical protein